MSTNSIRLINKELSILLSEWHFVIIKSYPQLFKWNDSIKLMKEI